MTELTRESLGINMETTLLGGDASNYETKLRLALTSSDDLPDVFPVYSAQLAADMIESGMVKDITDDITNLMPDRLKEIYDQYPNTYSTVTKDGKIYGMAVSPHLTEGEVMIIRQDWLDNLGLEAPTTIDEFEEVIRAFTEDDPDGNGEKDTYGFTYEGDTIYNNGWCADPVTIFSVYTGKNLPGQWQEDEDGKLVYGSLDEGNKKALERLARWHANGWGDGKARRWLVDEFLKERRVDGRNDLRLYNSILYKHFGDDFPDQSKKYYANEDASQWFDEWGQDTEDCYIRKYNTSYYREREDYFARNNYRIMRYADVLLSYAECLVETGTSASDAAVYVDKVRERAGLSKLKDSRWKDCLSSKEVFIKRLQMERALELCFEGWRWADLKRWGLLDSQAGIDELKARDKDFNNFVIGKHKRMPIPTSEVEISKIDDVPQLTQNPNY